MEEEHFEEENGGERNSNLLLALINRDVDIFGKIVSLALRGIFQFDEEMQWSLNTDNPKPLGILDESSSKDYENLAKFMEFVALSLPRVLMNTDILNSFTVVYFRLEEYEKAVKYCMLSRSIDPDFSYSYSSCGAVYYRMGRYYLAVDNLSRSLEFSPKHCWRFSVRGAVYMELRKPLESFVDCVKAAKLEADETLNCFFSRSCKKRLDSQPFFPIVCEIDPFFPPDGLSKLRRGALGNLTFIEFVKSYEKVLSVSSEFKFPFSRFFKESIVRLLQTDVKSCEFIRAVKEKKFQRKMFRIRKYLDIDVICCQ